MISRGTSPLAWALAAASALALAVPAVSLAGSAYPPPTTDTNPPETVITKGPKGTIHRKTTRIHFTADEVASTFQCRLGRTKFAACKSPVKIVKLTPGRYTFYVRATDPAGNVDHTPAKLRFRVGR